MEPIFQSALWKKIEKTSNLKRIMNSGYGHLAISYSRRLQKIIEFETAMSEAESGVSDCEVPVSDSEMVVSNPSFL